MIPEDLLNFVKTTQRKVHISQYSGQVVAVDGRYMMRGDLGAATPLVEGRTSNAYITHFVNFITMIKRNGVRPVVVFEGLPLPIKEITKDQRAKQRRKHLLLGRRLQKRGNDVGAEKCFQKVVEITEEMVRDVTLRLAAINVRCIVAPFEANAQLTYLMKTKKIKAIITENPDLIAFGCSKLIYNINQFGHGVEIKHQDLFDPHKTGLRRFNMDLLRRAFIASGCDYMPSLRGYSFKRLILLFQRFTENDHFLDWIKRYTHPRLIPDNYDTKFEQAHLAFRYQWVFDIDKVDYVRLNPLPEHLQSRDLSFLGEKPFILTVNFDHTDLKDNSPAVTTTSKASKAPISSTPDTSLDITNNVIAYVDSVKENIKPRDCQPADSLQQKKTATTSCHKEITLNLKRHNEGDNDEELPPCKRRKRIITLY